MTVRIEEWGDWQASQKTAIGRSEGGEVQLVVVIGMLVEKSREAAAK